MSIFCLFLLNSLNLNLFIQKKSTTKTALIYFLAIPFILEIDIGNTQAGCRFNFEYNIIFIHIIIKSQAGGWIGLIAEISMNLVMTRSLRKARNNLSADNLNAKNFIILILLFIIIARRLMAVSFPAAHNSTINYLMVLPRTEAGLESKRIR